MKPTVSVVMPTRGRHFLVRRAVESVLAQSFRNFEIIILDNSASYDREKIREVSSQDSRISFVDRGDTGVTEARKLGAILSKGSLFALMDSDDYWSKDRLEKHVQVWVRNRIGLSWDRWAQTDEKGSRGFPQPFPPGLVSSPLPARKLYSWNFIHASAGIVSTRFARAQGFPILNILSSDWALFMKAAEIYPAYFIGETLSFQDLTSPERVSNIEGRELFVREEKIVRRRFLLNNPRTYAVPYMKTHLNKLRRAMRSKLSDQS